MKRHYIAICLFAITGNQTIWSMEPQDSSELLSSLIANDNTEQLEVLLKNKKESANTSINNQPAVFYALLWEKPEAVKVLSQHGLDPYKKNSEDYFPASVAIANNDGESLFYLINDARFNPNVFDKHGNSLYYALAYNSMRDTYGNPKISNQLLEWLLKQNLIDLNKPINRQNETAMQYATRKKNTSAIELLKKYEYIQLLGKKTYSEK